MNEKNNAFELAKGTYWIGSYDDDDGLNCNPYLIIEGDEAVVIDGGNRTDFSSVVLKILNTGINIKNIGKLIYQHYDPDLCSSIPHLEAIIERKDLEILSHNENNIFIKYYGGKSKKRCIESLNMEYKFKTGRTLKFFRTPYSHSAGSFITFDEQTGILFSSDIFGFWGKRDEIFAEIDVKCKNCKDEEKCKVCPQKKLKGFHSRVMTSEKALRYAMNVVEKLPVKMIAPQHGSIFKKEEDIKYLIKTLRNLKGVGIDGWD